MKRIESFWETTLLSLLLLLELKETILNELEPNEDEENHDSEKNANAKLIKVF